MEPVTNRDLMFWRRLDTPGHDACRVERRESGWRLEGTAVFLHDGTPARLDYRVACDRAWRSTEGEVSGWLGERPVGYRIARTPAGAWILDEAAVPGLDGIVDLDYGFTPATNLLAIRRLALAEGQSAEAPAAWLDVAAGMLVLLPQRFARRGEARIWYEAPSVGYAAELEVTPLGFIRRYPGLWEEES
jgi:hypothetical protein